MKATLGKTAFAALVAVALAVPAVKAADQTLKDFKVGKIVRGDEVKQDDLEGRVVVFEYWGTR